MTDFVEGAGQATPTIVSAPIFARIVEPEYRQGEIITGVVQGRYDSSAEDVELLTHEFVIVASQDCDLLQDYTAISEGTSSRLNGILLYEAYSTPVFKQSVPPGKDIWKRIVQNNDDRYQALQAAPESVDAKGEGLPDLIVDFRRFFSITHTELRHQCANGIAARRCRLEMPYREQFQSRAAYYLQRVGVPIPHNIGSP